MVCSKQARARHLIPVLDTAFRSQDFGATEDVPWAGILAFYLVKVRGSALKRHLYLFILALAICDCRPQTSLTEIRKAAGLWISYTTYRSKDESDAEVQKQVMRVRYLQAPPLPPSDLPHHLMSCEHLEAKLSTEVGETST